MNWQWFEALGRSPKTRPGVRAVGLILAIRAKHDNPVCNPSIRTICKDAAVGHTTACAAIRHFEKIGMLEVERERGKGSVYRLTVPDSGTPTVPELSKVSPEPDCSRERNSSGPTVPDSGTPAPPTVPDSGTPPFPRANPKGKSSKPSHRQEDKVRLSASEVPY